MCGIAAITNSTDSQKLESMLEQIRSRGEKNHFNESASFSCVMGMNRLAIVDRDKAVQPITSSDGRYVIVFNGEIYNYKELKIELEKLGSTFNTDSDTEVLVNGYDVWREKMLPKLRGMFAFFIFDKQTNGFFVARDPFGIKPLYYAKTAEKYYFASEIKALSCLEEITEIELFKVGHYMKNGKLKKYYSRPSKTVEIDHNLAIGKIRNLFDQAVKRRVQTDLPIAVYLSGGIDSTAVLAAAIKYHPNVTAIIAGNSQSEDKKFAVRYCEESKIKYVIKELPTEEELAKSIPEIVRLTESFEPNMIRQSAVSYLIAKAAADAGFKIMLCGEGADEIFAGYPEFTQLENDKAIEERIGQFMDDLHRTQLQRVDRTSMAFTTEVRVPFLDLDLANFVLQIPAKFKIIKNNESIITKAIFRDAMSDRLPDYIRLRQKVVLSEGAGLKGNQKVGGLFEEIVKNEVSDKEFEQIKSDFVGWNLETKEEVYYFKLYKKFGYLKARFNQQRTSVNKIATLGSNAEKILTSFNTWNYKREQPKDVEEILKIIDMAITENKAIPFVLYWGKGEKKLPDQFEKMALDQLAKISQQINKVYSSGVKFTLIFTDTHAENNGYSPEEIKEYFEAMETLCREYGFDFIYISSICPLGDSYAKVYIPKNVLDILKISSNKHYKAGNAEDGAMKYFSINQIEKVAIAKQFLDSIFLTYSGSDLDILFPDLPIFYAYSTGKGCSEKPWFKGKEDPVSH